MSEKIQGKNLLLPLSSARLGEKEDLWCRSKWHCLLLSLFFSEMHETTSF